jgi:uncharacterized phage protein gp47/JayE
VQNSIDASCPVTATPTAFAPTQSPVAITINNLVPAPGFTEATAQANIMTALAQLFATTTPGGTGWDSTQRAFVAGGSLSLSQIYGAITGAPGVFSFDLAAPTADQVAGFGIMLSLGQVSS